MAAQRRKNEESIEGYIHNVSPVKKSRKNNSYFNAQLQTENDLHPIICYSPEKRTLFVNAQTLKSAVKISNVRLAPGKISTDIHANKTTDVISLKDPLPYSRKTIIEPKVKDATDVTITEVKYLQVNQVDKYNIKGKVVFIDKIKTANIHGEEKRCQDITVHDGSDFVDVTMFEDLTNKVSIDTSYKFNNVKVRIYNHIKLTSTKETTIEQIEEIFDIPASFKIDTSSNTITGTVISARITIITNCPSCHKIIPSSQISQSLLTCSTCQTRVKKNALITQTNTLIQIKDDKETEKLTIPNHIMVDFLKLVSKTHLLTNKTDLEDYLLDDDTQLKIDFNINKHATNIIAITN